MRDDLKTIHVCICTNLLPATLVPVEKTHFFELFHCFVVPLTTWSVKILEIP